MASAPAILPSAASIDSALNLRGAILPPLPASLNATRRRQVILRHPQYPDSSNILLNLFAPDTSVGGLQYEYVLVLCSIVAGNRWDGWFTKTKDGPRLDEQDILPAGEYFFHLGPQSTSEAETDSVCNSPYPIVPSFRDWVFPHNNLPPCWTIPHFTTTPAKLWSASSLTTALAIRDASCRITGCTEGTQVAHICPRVEAEWYQRNQMSQYHNNHLTNRLEDDTANALLLRADLHIEFDKRKFVFVPKRGSNASAADAPVFVTHLLVESSEYEYLYHNRALQGISQIGIEHLFARLAWSVFPFLGDFLGYGLARYLSIAAKDGSSNSIVGLVDAGKCLEYTIIKPSRSRNPSPRKRGRDGSDSIVESIGAEKACFQRKRPKPSSILHADDLTASFSGTSQPQTSNDPSEDNSGVKVLREQWLSIERSRSDPEHIWGAEKQWAEETQKEGATMNGVEAKRLLEYLGHEFREDDT
ncbi:unnamed protein product [Diplocarpon coronariae]